MQINRNIYCSQCRGSGAKDGKTKTCPKCKGQGVVVENVQMGFMQMQMQNTCNQCRGKGKTFAQKCPHCNGKRVVQDTKHLDIEIEKGMANGETIVLQREAEQVPDLARGDLIFTLRQTPHKTFKRVGDNLFSELSLSLEEALLGFTETMTHMDAH